MADLPSGGSCYERVAYLEKNLQSDFLDPRFLPYLSLHEFEALLLTSPDQIATALSGESVIPELVSILASASSPEEVDDGPTTHPSARLSRLLPAYRKRLHGPMIARRIGLDAIRRECPHFDQWLIEVEKLSPES